MKLGPPDALMDFRIDETILAGRQRCASPACIQRSGGFRACLDRARTWRSGVRPASGRFPISTAEGGACRVAVAPLLHAAPGRVRNLGGFGVERVVAGESEGCKIERRFVRKNERTVHAALNVPAFG
jgi:hypothetical protein